MTISAPSTEQHHISSGSPHDRPAWGQKARQPSLSKRLARTYDWCVDKYGDDLEVIGIAGCGAVPSALVFALAVQYGPFWAITTTACSIGFYAVGMISVVGLRDKLRDLNGSKLYQLCEERKDACDNLQAEVSQLQHDKTHLLCERGQLLKRLHEAEEAVTEQSRSENQEGSVTVVEFPNPKGAA